MRAQRRAVAALGFAGLLCWAGAVAAQEADGADHPVGNAQVLRPTALVDAAYRVFAREEEGIDGFSLRRMRGGFVLAPAAWFRGVGTVELAGESPTVLDAYARVGLVEGLSLMVGYSKPPLLATFFTEPVYAMVLPDRSVVDTAFRVRRDVGLELLAAPASLPLEARLRVGNGAGSPLGNDNVEPAGYAALDLVLGRAQGARPDAGQETLGLRVGASGLVESVEDRQGVVGRTPLGFAFYRPPVVRGSRMVVEGHVLGYAGPLRLSAEAVMASESRSRDDDGNPATERVDLPTVRSYGLTVELVWTALGEPRRPGAPPRVPSGGPRWRGGALEVALRYDGVWLGREATDVTPGGGQLGTLGVRWWPTEFVSAYLSGYAAGYDEAPIEAPGEDSSWGVIAGTSFFWGY